MFGNKNGEVISPFTGKPRKLNIGRQYGYERYRFNIRDEITKNAYPVEVHKLVAYQKYGNKLLEPKIEVRHLDGDSLNNLEENIAIGTRVDNVQDVLPEDRLASSINASTFNRKFTDLEMEEIRKFHTSYKETMERFDISSKGTLHYILNTKYQTNV